jgi:hypothetical protein
MKKVKAEIGKNGKVSIEFIGFKGEECTDERERLRKVMLDFGVMLEPKKIEKKTAQQIAREVAFGKEGTRVSFRR